MTRYARIFLALCLCALLGFAVLAPACGGGGGSGDDDDDSADDDDDDEAPRKVTYYEDVQPILYEHCVSCHGESRIAPFELLTYYDALEYGSESAYWAKKREMPPWNLDNSGDCNTYPDARWMSEEDIETLSLWADGDMLEGDPANGADPPPPPEIIPDPDVVIDPGVEYLPEQTYDDTYRCFVIDPGLTEDAYISAYQVVPGNPNIVHHAVLYAINSDEGQEYIEDLDAKTPDEPGFGEDDFCYGFSFLRDDIVPIALSGPGGGASELPSQTGLLLEAGRKVVLQVHYHFETFKSGDNSAKHGDNFDPDRTVVPLKLKSSVERPAVVKLVLPNVFEMELPPDKKSVKVTGEYPIPKEVDRFTVWGVTPHMHELGVNLTVEYQRLLDTMCLAKTHHWDFNWQDQGLFTEPVELEPNDILRVTCEYDTRGQDETVRWGPSSDDEMCIAYLYVSVDMK
ncbi:MAG: hypothetical protein H6683_04745 [Deltaproteobacteria bacterium]|nr:hypothetical protein [Deltaproteobacteria bacterium]MCB9478967.1 hypothetical protein [Deltaproteobacteria bacterium]